MKITTKLISAIAIASTVLFTACFEKKQEVKVEKESKKIYKWKLATTWGPTLSPLSDTPKELARMVKEMSKGEFTIRIDASNKHKSPFGILDMVKGGQYEMGHSASYYWKGKDLSTLPISTMPFGMTTPEFFAWYSYGGGKELTNKVYAKHSVLSFPGGNTGNQMGGWFRKEIKSLDDLKGLKMRIPGFAGEIMASLGVTVTNIAPGELYTSLERGTIDALEWVGPGMDIKMGFHKVAPYYYTGWHEPGTDLQYLVNEKAFNTLPTHLKRILKSAIKLTAYDTYVKSYSMNALAWSKMAKEYPNIQVKTLPQEVMNAMKEANKKLLIEKSKTNPLFAEIIASQNSFQKKAREWTKMSDYLYLKDNL